MKTNTTARYAYLITAICSKGRLIEIVQYHTDRLQAIEIAGRMLDKSGLTLIDAMGMRSTECTKRNVPYSFED